MLRRLVLTAAASVAALSVVPALPAVAQAGAARAEPASLSLMPPPARGEDSGDRLTVTVQHGKAATGRTSCGVIPMAAVTPTWARRARAGPADHVGQVPFAPRRPARCAR